jgi:hypothetical protein
VADGMKDGFYDVEYLSTGDRTVAKVDGDTVFVLGYIDTNQADFPRLWRVIRGPYEVAPHYLSFTCPDCHRTSYNPNDIRQRYCGNCHEWKPSEATRLHPNAKEPSPP